MLLFTEKFRLTQADFYADDRIRFSSVLDLFQTVASKHSAEIGASLEDMAKQNLAWVIARIKFTVILPLKYNELVTVQTYPHPKGVTGYERDYKVFDENGNLAIIGNSIWVLINKETRKISRPVFDYDGDFVYEFVYPDKIEHVASIQTPPSFSYLVTQNDIDKNGHMNNVRYADLVTATFLPEERSTLTVNFIRETKRGETVDMSFLETDIGTLYTGKSNGEVRFTAKIE